MATTYKLIFENHSASQAAGCLYQQNDDGSEGALPLAWFAKQTAPMGRALFQWTIDYCFVWGETGRLTPGVIFFAGQIFPAELETNNSITLTYRNGAFQFIDQSQGSAAGSLYIREDLTIPLNTASVGMGMASWGTFAVQAQPNFSHVFRPRPRYFITFGDYARGQVLDPKLINNPAEVVFPAGVTSMTATLNADNSWSITQTPPAASDEEE